MPHNKPKTSDKSSSQTLSEIFSGDVSLGVFLRDYWQKKPLLLRNAFPDIHSPISAEDLAGLACEDDVNARIVIEKDGNSPWEVQYGPFDEDSFNQLPESHWTLLVNDVEKYIPEAKDLFDQFRFIPDWRKDDMMISYAADGGSVGPHLDAYDVFLIQTQGQRNWKISHQHCNRFIDDIELKILSDFEADEEWILDPGDMLYLPPNLAHHGVAEGTCMTASVGFRAPSVRAITSEFAEYIANQTADTLRYSDPDIEQQVHPAEISASALSTVKELLKQQLSIDDSQLTQWFGEYMTDARSSAQLSGINKNITNFDTLREKLEQQENIQQSPLSRFLYTSNKGNTLLFVDGQSYNCSSTFAKIICKSHTINTTELINSVSTQHDKDTLINLYNRDCID